MPRHPGQIHPHPSSGRLGSQFSSYSCHSLGRQSVTLPPEVAHRRPPFCPIFPTPYSKQAWAHSRRSPAYLSTRASVGKSIHVMFNRETRGPGSLSWCQVQSTKLPGSAPDSGTMATLPVPPREGGSLWESHTLSPTWGHLWSSRTWGSEALVPGVKGLSGTGSYLGGCHCRCPPSPWALCSQAHLLICVTYCFISFRATSSLVKSCR